MEDMYCTMRTNKLKAPIQLAYLFLVMITVGPVDLLLCPRAQLVVSGAWNILHDVLPIEQSFQDALFFQRP